MLLVRQVFRAKYGRGDELVALLKEWHQTAGVPHVQSGRILTDASGEFFTVVTEYQVESLSAWEESFRATLGSADMERLFPRMVEVTESGRREFYNIVD